MEPLKIARLSDHLSVAPQIAAADVAAIAQAGFATIINNRPDNEEADQPVARDIADAAHKVGLDYYHQPVASGQITAADVQAFAANLAMARQPVLAFCRTGTRCSILWLMNNRADLDQALATARKAGYDLEHLRSQLAE